MANREPVMTGKGGRQITLESGYIVKRQHRGKYSYKSYHAESPLKLREALVRGSEHADIVADVYEAAVRLGVSAQIAQRRHAGR